MSQETEKRSYWSDSGKYQKQYDILQKLIPSEGKSFDTRLELLRCAGNVYYDMFNNGLCNCIGSHVPRDQELDLVLSQVDVPQIVEDFIEALKEESEQEEWDNSQSESMYDKACNGFDLIIDQVIEKILENTESLPCHAELEALE